jgi:WD40 repeat protein
VCVSRDGRWVGLAGEDGAVQVVDTKTGRPRSTLRGLTNNAQALAFAPDGRYLAGTDATGAVRLWDAMHDREGRTLTRPVAGTVRMAVDSLGSQIAFTRLRSTQTIPPPEDVVVTDVRTGLELRRFPGVGDVAFSPDDRSLAVTTLAGVDVYELASGNRRLSVPLAGDFARRVAFGPNGRLLAVGGSGGRIVLADAATGQTVRSLGPLPGDLLDLGFAAQDRLFASWAGGIAAFDVGTGAEVGRLARSSAMGAFDVSRDGKLVAASGHDRSIQIWDVEAGRVRTSLHGHAGLVWEAAFNPDATRVVSCSIDGTVRVWDVESGQELIVLPGARSRLTGVAWSADARRILALGALECFVWEVEAEGK